MGFTDEAMRVMKITPWQAMAGGFVIALIMAYVLAYDIRAWNQFLGSAYSPTSFALRLGFWIWFGYVATFQIGAVLWEGKSWKLFVLNASNSLISLICMSLILTLMK